MATVQYLLILCVLAGTLCLAQLDAQSQGAASYTHCGYGEGQLIISNFTLSPSSPQPTDQISLIFTIDNPTSKNVTVNYVYSTLNFPTPYIVNQSMYDLVVPANTTIGPWWASNHAPLNQIYSSGWVPFHLLLYSNSSELACWAGSVYVIAPPNQSPCSYSYSQLNLTSVTLHTNEHNQSFYITFKVENLVNISVSFNEVYWQITFNSAAPIWDDQSLSSPVIVGKWESRNLTSPSFALPQNHHISWDAYEFIFYYQGNWVGCWIGYQYIHPLPPNPPGCFNGNNLLNVNNVALHPSSPQIHDTIYLTFEVENWSDGDVTFTDIYSILTFNSSNPIAYHLTQLNTTVQAGHALDFTGNKVTLNESVSERTFRYQLAVYKDTTEISCWIGELVVPSPNLSSSPYFLGLVGLSVLFTS